MTQGYRDRDVKTRSHGNVNPERFGLDTGAKIQAHICKDRDRNKETQMHRT